ncbi:outer membrane lipoprotein carrier protein LolA [Ferrovum sp.]|uniref:LolA family protein n=2 Tax=Ferrovum sp. TaxID=2609467 RepID=UPI00262684AD|nr:outer membrane lipoprotein carrier protein LolA [Ferrovum sp.]
MKRWKPWAGVMLWMGCMGWASASGLDRLHAFLRDTHRGEAQFEQRNLKGNGDSGGTVSRGVFLFSRPGKFRWEYRSPYPQTLVADGQTLWIWDPDLQQVTRKKMSQSLGSTPAALLAGDDALEKGYVVTEGGESEGLEWVMAKPKSTESGFEWVRMGFTDQALARMELQDSFGHTLSIVFTQFDRDPKFTPDTFRFTPPPGADIIQ